MSEEDRRALVCGSTQGIGLAVAQRLASDGIKVVLMARNEARLQEALGTLAGEGHAHLVANFDDPDSVSRAVGSEPSFDILVNNTGGPPGGPILSAGTDEFETAFRRHLICNHLLVQSVVPHMKSQRWGRIVNVISTSIRQPIPGLGVSNTIRGAVASWAKTMAGELAPHGITMNNVLPGFTSTARLTSLFEGKADKTGKTLKQVEDAALASIPAGRFAEPSETAAAVAFLCSDAAAYITGSSLAVDGGRISSL